MLSETRAEQVGDTERLIALLESKLSLLMALRDLALHQAEVVAGHELSELMTLLSRKQLLMDRLAAIQDALSPYAHDDPETRPWVSPERRRMGQRIKGQCDELLQELLVMETRSIDNMTLQRDVVASQLQQVTDALRLSRAYVDVQPDGLNDGNTVSFSG